MRIHLAVFLLAFIWPVFLAAQSFPELTGRVVDQANILPPPSEAKLSKMLEVHERETSNQVVVVTVPDLQGQTIEDYGVALGRHWGIGSEDRDNGVLLIVAPDDRKVRIEVGYGLEGALTDATAHRIIQKEILPRFRDGAMGEGIEAGTLAILQSIEGEYGPQSSWNPFPYVDWIDMVVLIIFVLVTMAIIIDFIRTEGVSRVIIVNPGRRHGVGLFNDDDDEDHDRRRRNRRSLSIGGRRSSGSRGRFSGGGGSFGGGGSSGGW